MRILFSVKLFRDIMFSGRNLSYFFLGSLNSRSFSSAWYYMVFVCWEEVWVLFSFFVRCISEYAVNVALHYGDLWFIGNIFSPCEVYLSIATKCSLEVPAVAGREAVIPASIGWRSMSRSSARQSKRGDSPGWPVRCSPVPWPATGMGWSSHRWRTNLKL